jgi:hypothetical protein
MEVEGVLHAGVDRWDDHRVPFVNQPDETDERFVEDRVDYSPVV